MAMEDANESTEGSLEGWFNLRDKGGAKTWKDLDFESPEFKFLTMAEMPYGFKLKGTHGPYKIDAEVRIVTRDTDIFYDESTPCKRKSVTCINEYSRGTMGK